VECDHDPTETIALAAISRAMIRMAASAPEPPADANTWLIALTDERGAMVTSPVQFQP
jgi:hypothetical protein